MCQVVDIKTGKNISGSYEQSLANQIGGYLKKNIDSNISNGSVAKLSGVSTDEITDKEVILGDCPSTSALKRIHGVLLELSVSPSKLNANVREKVIGKIQEIVSTTLRYEQCDHSLSADMILELVTKIQLMELHAVQARQYLSQNQLPEPGAIQEILTHAKTALEPFNGGAA